jgi:hypothetical protein
LDSAEGIADWKDGCLDLTPDHVSGLYFKVGV